MVAGDAAVDGLDRSSFRLPAHFFAVYDGLATPRSPTTATLAEELRAAEVDRVRASDDLPVLPADASSS